MIAVITLLVIGFAAGVAATLGFAALIGLADERGAP